MEELMVSRRPVSEVSVVRKIRRNSSPAQSQPVATEARAVSTSVTPAIRRPDPVMETERPGSEASTWVRLMVWRLWVTPRRLNTRRMESTAHTRLEAIMMAVSRTML